MKVSPLLLLVAISVLFSACESRDAKLRKAVVGSWKVDRTEPGLKIVGTMTLAADGTLRQDTVITIDRRRVPLTYTGTWKVEDGYFFSTVETSSIAKLMPPERTSRSKILKATDQEFTFQNPKTGVTLVHARAQ